MTGLFTAITHIVQALVFVDMAQGIRIDPEHAEPKVVGANRSAHRVHHRRQLLPHGRRQPALLAIEGDSVVEARVADVAKLVRPVLLGPPSLALFLVVGALEPAAVLFVLQEFLAALVRMAGPRDGEVALQVDVEVVHSIVVGLDGGIGLLGSAVAHGAV